MAFLDAIQAPTDVRKLSPADLATLAGEMRGAFSTRFPKTADIWLPISGWSS